MSTTIIKGKIELHERTDKFDDDGIKFIQHELTINRVKYKFNLPPKYNFYFENQTEVVLEVDENKNAIAGICPKQNYSWGKTKALKGEVKESDRFELAKGMVIEKRKEVFNQSRGTTGVDSYTSSNKNTVTYTIVLPEKTFRVNEQVGKRVKPNTEIVALLEENVAYIIKDKTNQKIYGKPRKDYLIGLFLLIAFNVAMQYFVFAGKKEIFTSFNLVLIIGNIFFGIAFLISFLSFLSSSKTLKLFKQMEEEGK